MPMRVSNEYASAFQTVVARISAALDDHNQPANPPVQMYVAGGAATYLYTGARISGDIDASFSHRMLLPEKLEVSYHGPGGAAMLLYLDKQYNDTLGLMHEDADLASYRLLVEGNDQEKFDIRLLSPLDVAISKLSRYAENDQADIASLAALRVFSAEELRKRAEEALGGYVGDIARLKTSINLACKLVESTQLAQPDGATGHSAPPPTAPRKPPAASRP